MLHTLMAAVENVTRRSFLSHSVAFVNSQVLSLLQSAELCDSPPPPPRKFLASQAFDTVLLMNSLALCLLQSIELCDFFRQVPGEVQNFPNLQMFPRLFTLCRL